MKEKDFSTRLLLPIGYFLLAVGIIVTAYPLIQAVMVSLKPIEEFTVNPLGIPKEIKLSNYVDAWVRGDFSKLFFNSVLVTALTIVFTILLSSPAGFALAKLNLKGEKMIYNYFILGLIIPVQVIMIPLMKFARVTHMINTISVLVIIYTAISMALPIIIYTGFYKGLPNELIEAARIDGCSTLMIFAKIIFPLTTAVNCTVAITVGMNPWKDFFIPLLFTTDNNARTLPIGLLKFQSSFFNDWTVIFAATVILSLPLIVLYLIMQKTFIEGVTAGAVKG